MGGVLFGIMAFWVFTLVVAFVIGLAVSKANHAEALKQARDEAASYKALHEGDFARRERERQSRHAKKLHDSVENTKRRFVNAVNALGRDFYLLSGGLMGDNQAIDVLESASSRHRVMEFVIKVDEITVRHLYGVDIFKHDAAGTEEAIKKSLEWLTTESAA